MSSRDNSLPTDPHTPEDLQKIFNEAESIDKSMFAEMRSNILLIAGEHYAKKNSKFHARIRESKDLSQEQKIRLTKNHVQKIQKIYSNNITSYAPGVFCSAHNAKELADTKAAEIAESIWQHGKNLNNFSQKISDWSDEFTGIGEVHTMLFWNPNAGTFKGFEQESDEEGNPLYTDPNGEETAEPHTLDGLTGQVTPHDPLASERPVFSGQLQFKTLFGFNLMRAPEANSFEESGYLIVREMADKKDVLNMLDPEDPDFEEKKKNLESSSKDQFVIFDAQRGTYEQNTDLCLILYFYFKPCVKYPKGYWYLTTSQCEILLEGDLPFGIFPIVSTVFDKAPTLPRGISPVRTMRPYQIEINRCASKIAEHQITLGDDKLITQTGTKISQGASVPGVRQITVQGAPPTILAGRSGEQYAASMTNTIAELYDVMMCKEMDVEVNGQLDPYAMLFRSASQKQKFNRNTKRFEGFLKKVAETYLDLARNYLPEDELIPAVGKREMVNISEFKNQNKLDYLIKVEPQSEDIESRLGRQLSLNHLLQYTAAKLEKQDIGMIYRLMPYGNDEEMSQELTLDYDNATNMILALDRGEQVQADMNDDKSYMIRKLTNRMRQADFKSLPPQVQSAYNNLRSQYQQLIAQEQQQIQAAEADFIPTSGPLVVVDFYVDDPMNPDKTRRARLPYQSIQWLIERLQQQGSSLSQLENMQQGDVAGISNKFLGLQAPGHAQPGMPGANGMAPGAPGMARRNGPGVVPHGNGNPSIPGNGSLNTFNPNLIGAGTSPG